MKIIDTEKGIILKPALSIVDLAGSGSKHASVKEMKRRFYRRLYCQRNKNETILSMIKRMFGEHITSRSVRMQNRELTFRVIAYNMHRLSVFMVWFLQSHKT